MGYYELESCPHCRKLLDIRQGVASKSPIGPPIIACPHCGHLVKTGQLEWQTMTERQKVSYYIRVCWWCFGAFALIGGGVGSILTIIIFSGKIISPPAVSPLKLLLLSTITIGGIAIIWNVMKAKSNIYDSQRRTIPQEGITNNAHKRTE